MRRDVVARRLPSASARAVGTLRADTPEATTNIVPLLARRRAADGELWLRVRLPALPNGTTRLGAAQRARRLRTARTHLIVDLDRRRATLLRDGRTVMRFPVGVGAPDAPTPRGEFIIRNRLTRYRSAFYGPIALGTSARSTTLTDWPGGGYVGIHGTNEPGPDPRRGVTRLHPDAQRGHRPPRPALPVGTPLTIR